MARSKSSLGVGEVVHRGADRPRPVERGRPQVGVGQGHDAGGAALDRVERLVEQGELQVGEREQVEGLDLAGHVPEAVGDRERLRARARRVLEVPEADGLVADEAQRLGERAVVALGGGLHDDVLGDAPALAVLPAGARLLGTAQQGGGVLAPVDRRLRHLMDIGTGTPT